MSRVAIVGAGQAGCQLALGLLAAGFDVTLVSERTPDEIRIGPVLSSQCMFDSALATERALGLDDWARSCPPIDGLAFTTWSGEREVVTRFAARLDAPAQSVDQRVKMAGWIERFTVSGGDLRVRHAEVADLEDLVRDHDLVVVATGKGELGRLFPVNRARSPYNRPQRALALTYVNGMRARPGGSAVAFNMVPGVGEYFCFPALTTTGACEIMVFEGVPQGPMDCWEDVTTPQEHLQRSLSILERFFPEEAERCRDVQLTDRNGILRGRLTPTVRDPVAVLPSGARVIGLGDAVVLNDPVTGQGSNIAAQAATFYLESIVANRGDFDAAWMRSTFEKFWRGWTQWVVSWTNSVLEPLRPHQQLLMQSAAKHPAVASAIVNGFDDPRTFYPWWFDPDEAARLIEQSTSAEAAAMDPRALRTAFGHYATGVTVVTTRAADGRKIGMTANSFTSVSLDPPMVLWCPSRTAPSTGDFLEATHFAVNVLAADQHHLSRQFATPSADKFAGVDYVDGVASVPVLKDTVASFECRTVATHDAGDHIVMLGEVESFEVRGGPPLVFHTGSYHVATKHPDL